MSQSDSDLGRSDPELVERCRRWAGWVAAIQWYTSGWWTTRQTRDHVLGHLEHRTHNRVNWEQLVTRSQAVARIADRTTASQQTLIYLVNRGPFWTGSGQATVPAVPASIVGAWLSPTCVNADSGRRWRTSSTTVRGQSSPAGWRLFMKLTTICPLISDYGDESIREMKWPCHCGVFTLCKSHFAHGLEDIVSWRIAGTCLSLLLFCVAFLVYGLATISLAMRP